MKKLILIALCALPLCQAADRQPSRLGRMSDRYRTWDEAVEEVLFFNETVHEAGLLSHKTCAPLIGRKIHFIAPTAPEKLKEVDWLWLNGNRITEIPKEFNLEKLEVLSLEGNPIESLDVDSFLKQFPALRFLNLKSTPLAMAHNIWEIEKKIFGNIDNRAERNFKSEYSTIKELKKKRSDLQIILK